VQISMFQGFILLPVPQLNLFCTLVASRSRMTTGKITCRSGTLPGFRCDFQIIFWN
jgi:hypothetical protein